MVNNYRPVHLDLKTIRFPITAIISILHRISGILLFIIIGPILWILKLSLSSNDDFIKINDFLLANIYIIKFLLWGIIITLSYHIISGIRHILIDLGYLHKTLFLGNISAKIVLMLIILLSICTGILIWFS